MLLIEHLGEGRINKRVDVRRLLLPVSLVVLRRSADTSVNAAQRRRAGLLLRLRGAADLCTNLLAHGSNILEGVDAHDDIADVRVDHLSLRGQRNVQWRVRGCFGHGADGTGRTAKRSSKLNRIASLVSSGRKVLRTRSMW